MLTLAPTPNYGLRARACLAAVILASIMGCGKLTTGGGSRRVSAGAENTTAVYGFDGGMKLAFVVFTDISSDGTVASGGSTWTGSIAPKKGRAVNYTGSADRLDINGTEYKFANGRVFFVSTKDDAISVSQLDLPIGDENYDAEIDRIAETEEMQRLLSK